MYKNEMQSTDSIAPRPHPLQGEKGVWLQYDIPAETWGA